MKILYYVDPWIEFNKPLIRYHNIRYQLGPQIEAIAKKYDNIEVTIICNEAVYSQCLKDDFLPKAVSLKYIEIKKLKTVFNNYEESASRLYLNTAKTEQKRDLANLIKDCMGGKTPDIVISFISPLKFLEDYWQNTSVIYVEFGMFSRAPFPRTFYLDPIGMFRNSFISQYKDNLLNAEVSDNELKDIRLLRQSISMGWKSGINDPHTIKSILCGKYEKTLLLPLQFSNYFGFDSNCDYSSQFEYLLDVLDKVPSNIGIIVSHHEAWPKVIDENNKIYLKNRYKNLILPEDVLGKTSNNSQLLLNFVDGVIGVSSSVGLQAVFHGKPLFCLGDSHLNAFNEGNLEDAVQIINSFESKKYEKAITYLLSNYFISDKLAYNAEWVMKFFQKVIDSKYGESFDFKFSDDFKDINNIKLLQENLRFKDISRDLEKINKYIKNNKLNSSNPTILSGTSYPRDWEISLHGESYFDDLKIVLSKYEYISFDIFDTLLERPFARPHQMFGLMDSEVKKILKAPSFEFHNTRRAAENYVRKNSIKEEVTIDEIYERLIENTGFDRDKLYKVKQLEWDYEKEFCKPRQIGRLIYDIAISLKKKIIIISDYYFPGNKIIDLLYRNGFSHFDHLYVSCDHNKTKLTGNLFKEVISSLEISANKVFHCGDNYNSDIKNALNEGFSTFHIPKSSDLFFSNTLYNKIWGHEKQRVQYPTSSLKNSTAILLGMISNRLYSQPFGKDTNSFFSGYSSNLGYCLIGPIMVGFILDLLNRIKERSIDKLFFLSRDGLLIKKCFDLFKIAYNLNIDYEYVLSSRKALMFANVTSLDDFLSTLDTPFEPTDIRTLLLQKYDLDDSCISDTELASIGLVNLKQKLHPNNDYHLLRLILKHVYPKFILKIKGVREATRKYYGDKIKGTQNQAIVDVGYTGSAAIGFEKLLGENFDCFFLISTLAASNAKEKGVYVKGYLEDGVDHTSNASAFYNFLPIFETMIGSNLPSLKYFSKGDENDVIPIFENSVNLTYERDNLNKAISRGCLDFVHDFCKVINIEKYNITFPPSLVLAILKQYSSDPQHADALLLNNINHEDNFSSRGNRYIVSDISSALKKHKNLTKEQATMLVNQSDWKYGARAILPLPRSELGKKDRSVRKVSAKIMQNKDLVQSFSVNTEIFRNQSNIHKSVTHSAVKQSNGRKSISRKYRKFTNNPREFFQDSKFPFVRIFSKFFIN